MLSSDALPVGDGVRLAVEAAPEVVRGEDREGGDVPESLRSEEPDVRVGAEEDSRVTDEALQTPYCLLEVVIEVITRFPFRNDWDREIFREPPRRPDRAGTATPSAVRRRERLVKVQVDAGNFALGTRRGAEGESLHPRYLREHPFELVEDREESLRRFFRLERVSMPHPVGGGDQLRDLRVVLHRATPQRIHPELNREVHLRKTVEVPQDLKLGELGEVQVVVAFPPELARDVR